MSVRKRFADLFAIDQAQFDRAAEQSFKSLQHVKIGRKISAFRNDDAARRLRPHSGRRKLEEIDRGRIRRDHLVGSRADQGRDLRADACWQADPVVCVPASDQVHAPFAADHLGDPRGRGRGQRAERIAVEIDDVAWNDEAVPRLQPAGPPRPSPRNRPAKYSFPFPSIVMARARGPPR